MIKTERLLLRQWEEDDILIFVEMCRDKDVMEFFPKLQNQVESEDMAAKIQALINDRGWGFWAVEIPNQHQFIGFVGLHTPKESLSFSPCVEIGWRLSKQHWGKGYATEAAKSVLNYAFSILNLDEVVSFTSIANVRSMAVMTKLGMSNTHQNFMHPDIEGFHPLCEHVLYKISKIEWQKMQIKSLD